MTKSMFPDGTACRCDPPGACRADGERPAGQPSCPNTHVGRMERMVAEKAAELRHADEALAAVMAEVARLPWDSIRERLQQVARQHHVTDDLLTRHLTEQTVPLAADEQGRLAWATLTEEIGRPKHCEVWVDGVLRFSGDSIL